MRAPAETAGDAREWVVLRTATETQTFRGIFADDADEAIEAFYRGAGELDQEATDHSEWKLTARLARSVRERATEDEEQCR